MSTLILCEPHTLRWYCMRGHDGAPAGICPLTKCDRRGANATEDTAAKEDEQ